MGRKIGSLETLAIAGCLVALSVTAQPLPVRVEAEIMGTRSFDTYFPVETYYNVNNSGSWFIDTKANWVHFENIIAPSDGAYNITFRMKPESNRASGNTELVVKNDQVSTWVSACNFGTTDSTTWTDFVFPFDLKAGANCIEIGGCGNYYGIDYLEWDSSTGLSFEPVIKHRPLRLEMEDAVLSGATTAAEVASGSGASSGEYLKMKGTGVVTATVTFEIAETKKYYIRYVARNPAAPSGQGDELKIDGASGRRNAWTKVPYNNTDWHGMVIVEWEFTAGTHSIAVLSGAASTLQYDYIEIDGAGPDAPEGDITLTGEMRLGETISLTAPATTHAGAEYHWMLGDVPLSDSKSITGANARVLVIEDLRETDNGDYTVVYTHTEGDELVSNPLTVIASGPHAEPIVSDPPQGFIVDGGSLTLTAPAGAVSYQWWYKGDEMSDTEDHRITGVNSQVLVFSQVTSDDNGTYTCVYDTGSGKQIFVTPPFVVAVVLAGSVPVAGIIGLALLAASTALGGAFVVRRKKH